MKNRTQIVLNIVIAALIGILAGFIWLAGIAYAQTVEGNPTCSDIGFDGVEFKDDGPTLFVFDNGTIRVAYFDEYTVSGVLNLRPHDFDLEAVIVKGGPAATVQIGGPYAGLSAPVLDSGNVPAISHVSVCLSPKEPTTTTVPETTTTTDPKTTTTTEVPPSTTLPPTTTTSTSSPSTTATTSTVPPTSTPPTSSTPSTTIPPTPTSPTTSPSTTTSPPSTTTPPEIIEQNRERLPDTGWGSLAVGVAGFVLVTLGVALARAAGRD